MGSSASLQFQRRQIQDATCVAADANRSRASSVGAFLGFAEVEGLIIKRLVRRLLRAAAFLLLASFSPDYSSLVRGAALP